MTVRKAIFPVAGLDTRFLPATKSIPKEILTLVDRPLIDYAVEEARAAGKPVRADDNEESVRIRLTEYYKKTSPLIGYYYAKGDLKSVDGLQSMEEVKADIAKVLG